MKRQVLVNKPGKVFANKWVLVLIYVCGTNERSFNVRVRAVV